MRPFYILICILIQTISHADFFQTIPKTELHIHLGGAIPLPYLLSIATPEQAATLQERLNWVQQRVPYRDVFSVFSCVSQIINTEEKLQNGTIALCRDLEADGVFYAEIRTSLKDLGHGYEAYLTSVLNGINQANSDQFIGKLILSLHRSSTPEMARTTIDLAIKYQTQGIVGIDISGDSTMGEIQNIINELIRAKEHGLFITLHIGEHPDETNQLQLLQILQPERIGHAVHLTPEATEWIRQNRTPIELCLSSSYLCRFIENYHDHPALSLMREGHPITICTDDPLIFNTSPSKELSLFYDIAEITTEETVEIIEKSINFTFYDCRKVGCSV